MQTPRVTRRYLRLRNNSPAIFLFVALFALASCKDKKKEEEEEEATPKQIEAPEDTDEHEAPATGGGSLGMMSALLSSQADQPGPYDAPETSSSFDKDKPYVAIVEISGPIVELRRFSLTGGMEGTELRRLTEHLGALAADSKTSALVLRFGNLAIGPAMAEELRAELLALGAAYPDKPIACHAESVSTFTYAVMSACTQVVLTPGGDVSIPGVAAVPVHLKGLLDKVGVRADFMHVGDYKGAAEPLTLARPSKQANETTSMILDQAYESLVSAIATGRSLPREKVVELIDRAIFKASDAQAEKLIDQVLTYSEFRDGLGNAWRLAPADDSNPTEKLFELIGLRPRHRPDGERVALVYAVGNVVDGGGGAGGASTEITSRTLVDALDAIGRDDDVKAVVIRVSSPGGSALASEVIWSAVERLKKSRSVVISMGAVAASGGYYISAPATRIFALSNTLTGSIGVVGGKLATSGGLRKLGIETFPRGRGKHALVFASPEPWTASERKLVLESMRAVYGQFASRVRAGRGAIDDSLMQGRVWTGKKALEHKLVDEVGGLTAALKFARASAGLGADSELEVYPPEPTLKDILGSFGVSSSLSMSQLIAGYGIDPFLERTLLQVADLVDGFRQHPVATALILPVVIR